MTASTNGVVDVDECATDNGGCAHKCRNSSPGSVICSCNDGYKLAEDKRKAVKKVYPQRISEAEPKSIGK